MGYSARYHAVSIAAVFLALAIGILIGAGFGNDVVKKETNNLEKSLKGDVVAARSRAEQLQADLNQEREFGEAAYPALVGGLLSHERVAVIGLGGDQVSGDVEAALEPSGGRLAEVATVREPADLAGLASQVPSGRFPRLRRGGGELDRFAARAGRALVDGGPFFESMRTTLLSRFSGRAGGVNAIVVARQQPADLGPRERDTTQRLESGLIKGLRATGVPVVGVELSDTDPSSIGFFQSLDLSTVDSVNLTSGRVALAYALAGAQGNFGVKDTADRLLPELLGPVAGAGPGP